jgi:hypothetical protein
MPSLSCTIAIGLAHILLILEKVDAHDPFPVPAKNDEPDIELLVIPKGRKIRAV